MPDIGYHQFKCFVIPQWIHRTLVRNSLTLMDLFNYGKVRKVMSLDDLAELVYVNEQVQIDKKTIGNNWLDSHFHYMTEAERAEYNRHVLNLSFSEDVKSSVNAKLLGSNPMNEQNYTFVYIDNILFVLIGEGFLKTMENNDNKEEFVKNYLTKCYEFLPVAKVSELSMYSLYLRQLSIKAIAA